MSTFQTERPSDIYEKQRAIAEANRRRKEFLRNSIDQEKMKRQADAITESVNTIDATNESKQISELQQKRMDRLASQRLNELSFMLEKRLVEEGYNKCFNTAIFNIVYEACWIDDDVKKATVGQMVDAYKRVVEVLEESGIEKTPSSQDNAFIANVKEVAMEAAKKTAKRIAKDTSDSKEANGPETIKAVKFDMTEEESKDLQTNLADLGPDEISELVKDKVLTVIQDEQKTGEKKAQIFNEIEDATATEEPKEEETSEEPAEEPKEEDKTEEKPEESTEETPDDANKEEPKEEEAKESTSLLEALLAMDNQVSKKEETPVEESIEEEIPQKKITIPNAFKQEKIRRSNRFIGTSLFECIMIDAARTVSESIATEGVEVKDPNMVMDAAFMESVMTYTVLETFNTLNLYKFDNISTRKLAEYFKNR